MDAPRLSPLELAEQQKQQQHFQPQSNTNVDLIARVNSLCLPSTRAQFQGRVVSNEPRLFVAGQSGLYWLVCAGVES